MSSPADPRPETEQAEPASLDGLLRSAAEGNRAAFAALYDRLSPVVCAAARIRVIDFTADTIDLALRLRFLQSGHVRPGTFPARSLLTATVNIAAIPNHPVAPLLRQRWVSFQAVVQRALAHDIGMGREPETMDPARGAEQLIATYEGLQLQSMLRPHMDVLEAYDRAVTRLRTGWSHQYQPPV